MSKNIKESKSAAIVKPYDKEWKEWEEICEYTNWDPKGILTPMKYHGKIVPFSRELGVGPRFLNELKSRINSVKPIRINIVGEAGSGKTYAAIALAVMLDKDFCIQQVVLSAGGYVALQTSIRPKLPVILEEPTFLLAARSWQNEFQKIVVQIIESSRFQNNPLLIPIVSRTLLDKTVREFYINYVIQIFERGFAKVYFTWHSQWEDKSMKKTKTELYIYDPGVTLARCGRTTCLSCPKLWKCSVTKESVKDGCDTESCIHYKKIKVRRGFKVGEFEDICSNEGCQKNIYAIYERKRERAITFYQRKGVIQLESFKEKMAKNADSELSLSDLDKIVDKHLEELKMTERHKVNATSLQMIMEAEGLNLSRVKCEHLAKRALLNHPELAEENKNN